MPYKLFVKAGSPFQIDGFSEKAKRSTKGSIHFRPFTNVVVTDDEWEKIKLDGLENLFDVEKIISKKQVVEKPKTEKLYEPEKLHEPEEPVEDPAFKKKSKKKKNS